MLVSWWVAPCLSPRGLCECVCLLNHCGISSRLVCTAAGGHLCEWERNALIWWMSGDLKGCTGGRHTLCWEDRERQREREGEGEILGGKERDKTPTASPTGGILSRPAAELPMLTAGLTAPQWGLHLGTVYPPSLITNTPHPLTHSAVQPINQSINQSIN